MEIGVPLGCSQDAPSPTTSNMWGSVKISVEDKSFREDIDIANVHETMWNDRGLSKKR